MRQAFLTNLNEDEAEFLNRDWRFWARRSQLAPDGDWRIWLFMGGRGSGKTRAGAQWIAEGVARGLYARVALIGATHNDARQVMIEGESGLLRAAPAARYEPSNNRVLWPSGAIATVLSAEEPDSIRGHQFDAGWGDAPGFRRPNDACAIHRGRNRAVAGILREHLSRAANPGPGRL